MTSSWVNLSFYTARLKYFYDSLLRKGLTLLCLHNHVCCEVTQTSSLHSPQAKEVMQPGQKLCYLPNHNVTSSSSILTPIWEKSRFVSLPPILLNIQPVSDIAVLLIDLEATLIINIYYK